MDRSCWKDFLHQQRQLYAQLTEEIVLQPQSLKQQCEDHPLNPNPDSQWQSFFKDNEVLLQIDKDVRRLCPDISFFSQPTEFPNCKITTGQSERLHVRVQQTCLKSQNLERKGLGIAKVCLFNLVQVCSSLYMPVQACSSLVQGCSSLFKPCSS